MQLGMIGLGRMGANMVQRVMRAGHECVVYDVHPESVQELVKEGAVGATSLSDLASSFICAVISCSCAICCWSASCW